MSLDHDFLLLDRSTDPPESYGRHIHSPEALHLHHDLVSYMLDFLSWIPTENPARGGAYGMGLNLYGPTVVSQRGARKLQELCSALALLFAAGPETLELRGSYGWIGEDPSSGSYQRVTVARDELVAKLSQLAAWGDAVADSPAAYLLHLGI